MGNENFLYLELGDREFTARIDSAIRPEAGQTVRVTFDEAALYLFDATTGEAVKTKTDDADADVAALVSG
jgi:multiple sugar transport system ATP-binding protein